MIKKEEFEILNLMKSEKNLRKKDEKNYILNVRRKSKKKWKKKGDIKGIEKER